MSQTDMKLDKTTFIEVVKHAPLVAIDLIVKNHEEKTLVGLRQNEPAQATWFVPGGRILKNERIAQAFNRITTEELGQACIFEQAKFRGVFEHFYSTNFVACPGFGTHYIVLAYECSMIASKIELPQDQHQQYQWLSDQELLEHPQVHPYTKAYVSRGEHP